MSWVYNNEFATLFRILVKSDRLLAEKAQKADDPDGDEENPHDTADEITETRGRDFTLGWPSPRLCHVKPHFVINNHLIPMSL